MSHTNELDNGVAIIANGGDLSGDVTFVLPDGRRMETTWDRMFALEAENVDLKEREEIHYTLVRMQHERTIHASLLWQKAHNRPNTIPDLGDLIEWLLAQIAAKDEALRALISWADEPAPSCAVGARELFKKDLAEAKAALSPPTGMVLVRHGEVKQIARTIETFAGFLLGNDCDLDETGEDYVKTIQRTGKKLAALLKDSP